MQFKRPMNVAKTRKDGVPTYVNSFQFLRANKLVLSVKARELVNGWEIPAKVMARCKGEPLTAQELEAWKEWKREHDKEELIDTDVARYRQAAEQVAPTVWNASHALEYDLVTLTEADVAEQRKAWDHYDKRLEALGFKRPTRPRGRPKTEPPPQRVIELDGGEIGWLPNFHKPGTPEHAEYEEAMRRAGKKPGDPS